MVEEDGELVPSEAGQQMVPIVQDSPEPVGRLDEDPVAGGMTQAVVDPLEAVDVDEHDGEPPAAAEPLGHAVEEMAAVGQAGQRVHRGRGQERLLVAGPFDGQGGEVGGGRHDLDLLGVGGVGGLPADDQGPEVAPGGVDEWQQPQRPHRAPVGGTGQGCGRRMLPGVGDDDGVGPGPRQASGGRGVLPGRGGQGHHGLREARGRPG